LWLWLMMSCTWMIIVCCVDHTGNMAAWFIFRFQVHGSVHQWWQQWIKN
jgi:hypothetical protein